MALEVDCTSRSVTEHEQDFRGMQMAGSWLVRAMTTWGFIGSGNIGTTLARLAVDAGHHVVMSNSRGRSR